MQLSPKPMGKRLAEGQLPLWHGLMSQHPRKLGVMVAQVYGSPPTGQETSVIVTQRYQAKVGFVFVLIRRSRVDWKATWTMYWRKHGRNAALKAKPRKGLPYISAQSVQWRKARRRPSIRPFRSSTQVRPWINRWMPKGSFR